MLRRAEAIAATCAWGAPPTDQGCEAVAGARDQPTDVGAAAATGGTDMTSIEQIVEEMRGLEFVVSWEAFAFMNRCLNQHGHWAEVRTIDGAGLVYFTVGKRDGARDDRAGSAGDQ